MSSASAAGPPKDLPARIGGYRVLRELGRGRLGPVVLAAEWGTGRRVALRVLKPEWACLPKYVARLTRDAFAAEQMEHPNVARVEGFGESQGRVSFATEFVDGDGLAVQGGMTPPRAVAHVLQAARGLRFAHGQGLTHGDVRPENLLVDRDGRTKLTDLGLSRTPADVEADEARAARGPLAVGPEAQALADAAPFRADVKGLGLTLTRLVTGGGDAHPSALIAAGVPMNLVELIRGMVDPKPGGNAADLNQVVAALERFLNGRGTSAAGTSPSEDDTAVLAESVRAFRASPAARARRRFLETTLAICGLLVGLGLLTGHFWIAGGVLGLAGLTTLAYFVIVGLTRGSALFSKARALVVESRGGDWLIGLAVSGVFAAALFAMNMHWAWIGFVATALCFATALHFAADVTVAAERRGAIEEARALLRRLRLQGVSEESLWRFVRSTAGDGWGGEPFFEELFGFEALRQAREPSDRGLLAALRRRSVPGREAVAAWVDARRAGRRRQRDWVLIQAIEERGLVAEGVNLLTARRKARRIADALLAVAAEVRSANRAAAAPPGAEVAVRPTLAWAVKQAAEAPENVLVEHEAGPTGPDFSWVGDLVYGSRTRFLLGSVLLAGFLLWVHQNRVISEEQVKAVASRALEDINALRDARIDVRLDGATRPLALAIVPGPVARLFNGFAPGAAGLILIVSSLLGGTRVGLFAMPGAAIAFFGPSLGVPPLIAMAAGAGVAGLGLVFGRRADG